MDYWYHSSILDHPQIRSLWHTCSHLLNHTVDPIQLDSFEVVMCGPPSILLYRSRMSVDT